MASLRALGPVLLVIVLATPFSARSQSADETSDCRWLYSSAGAANYRELASDPERTPLDELRFGDTFGPGRGVIARAGALDFDGDRIWDLFRAIPRPDGALQWQYAAYGRSGWINLAYATNPLADLRFGDFDGDGRTDVFSTLPRTDGNLQWVYSQAGYTNFIPLAYDPTPLADLRFGDFDGDGRTDVFSAVPRQDGALQWRFSSGGAAPWQNLAYASNPLADLRFGDFDGDGKTDVFSTLPGPDGNLQWVYSSGGSAGYVNLAHDPTPLAELRFGDFDGDGRTDVFATTAHPDGFLQWRFSSGGAAPWQNLAYAINPLADLRFGDFDFDGRTDVVVVTCPELRETPFPVARADRALGQPGLAEGAPNRGGGPAANTLAGPVVPLISPQGQLFVADYFNSRVLIWNDALAAAGGQPADHVLGQPSLTAVAPSPFVACAPATAASMCGPEGLAFDPRGSGRLYVADTHNHRVLAYDGPFNTSGKTAARVYGQLDFISQEPNRGQGNDAAAGSLYFPRGLAFDDKRGILFVADDFNRRVLLFFTDSLVPDAYFVLGQAFLGDDPPAACPPASATSLCSPKGLTFDRGSNTLYVADYAQARVLQYRGPFYYNNPPALRAFGQPSLTAGERSCQYRQGSYEAIDGKNDGPIAPDRFCNPIDLAVDATGDLFVADATNSRILVFDNPLDPGDEATAPDYALGQGGALTSGEKNAPDPPGAIGPAGLHRPMGMAFYDRQLFLSDFENNRVLRFPAARYQLSLPNLAR